MKTQKITDFEAWTVSADAKESKEWQQRLMLGESHELAFRHVLQASGRSATLRQGLETYLSEIRSGLTQGDVAEQLAAELKIAHESAIARGDVQEPKES